MHDFSRYSRQIAVPEIGIEGQLKLLQSSVLIIGVGGLGCPAAQQLCAAGVGKVCLVDGDSVSLSNLHRQLLFSMQDVGVNKATAAADKLRLQFPEIAIQAIPEMLTPSLALKLVAEYSIVIDASDRISVRYLIDDVCRFLGKPWVYGAINRFSAQWAIFRLPENNIGYRDLFPTAPNSTSVSSCNISGVIGMVPAIVGSIQALETVKYLTNIPVCMEVQSIDLQEYKTFSFALKPISKNCEPASEADILRYNYSSFCGENSNEFSHELTFQELQEKIKVEKCLVLDVREEDEFPVINWPNVKHIPLALVGKVDLKIDGFNSIICICQSGSRSKKAVEILTEIDVGMSIYSLKGGILGTI